MECVVKHEPVRLLKKFNVLARFGILRYVKLDFSFYTTQLHYFC